jgi:hypothetical protein
MPIINMVYKKKKGWKPWANTIAYYPLTDDFNDHSWNWYNLTSNSVQLTTISWVKCANMNNSYCTSNALVTSLPYSIVFWAKAKTSGWNKAFSIMWQYSWSWGWSWIMWWELSNTNNINIRYWNATNTYSSISQTIDTSWHLYVVTYSTGWCYLYIDGTQTANPKSSLTNSVLNTTPFRIWANYEWTVLWNWYMWAVIVEDKARTAQEISNYYNLTKSNYWL